jgi:hypothetical protein
MDNWRPNGKVGGNQTGFWGATSFPSVSTRDRSLLVPLVMLNACLTFSCLNKVPFNREASDTIWARINSDWQMLMVLNGNIIPSINAQHNGKRVISA